MKTLINHLTLIILLSLSATTGTWATPNETTDDAPSTLFEYMDQPEILKVTLEMDIETLLDNKKTNDFLPATFSFQNSQGQLSNWDIEVRVRGRFRRMSCEFPPLKLKFPKAEMKAEGFGKHNDVKLVTHCADSKEGEENLFREYLAYKMYAQLTDVSFRVQLIDITYIDSNTGAETSTYGILIEDADEMAERLNAKECEDCFGMTGAQIDRSNVQIHDLFQYMIGNTDWSVKMVRNMKILKPANGEGQKMIAPYDFDFSGLVNAAYAKPNVDLQQEDIRDRIYIGSNWTAEEWQETIALFQSKRQSFMSLVDNFEQISNKAKKDIKKYLNGFYEELDGGFVPQNVTH